MPNFAMLTPTSIRISAVICTRNRPHLLCRALRSLLNQRDPPFEIIVVDNAPRRHGVKSLITQNFTSVQYVVEPVEGLDFARNSALGIASGEVVAFLDDDAVADPGWIGVMQDRFARNTKLGACTGQILPLGLATEGERLFEANGSFNRGEQTILLDRNGWKSLNKWPIPPIAWAVRLVVGANLAVRRIPALVLGGFDEGLDLGAALPGGGDIDLAWRFVAAGYELIYEPESIVWHEHRADVQGVCSQIVGHHKALIAMLTKAFRQSSGMITLASIFIYLQWRLLKPGIRLVRRCLGNDPLPEDVLLQMWKTCLLSLRSYSQGTRIARQRRMAALDSDRVFQEE